MISTAMVMGITIKVDQENKKERETENGGILSGERQ